LTGALPPSPTLPSFCPLLGPVPVPAWLRVWLPVPVWGALPVPVPAPVPVPVPAPVPVPVPVLLLIRLPVALPVPVVLDIAVRVLVADVLVAVKVALVAVPMAVRIAVKLVPVPVPLPVPVPVTVAVLKIVMGWVRMLVADPVVVREAVRVFVLGAVQNRDSTQEPRLLQVPQLPQDAPVGKIQAPMPSQEDWQGGVPLPHSFSGSVPMGAGLQMPALPASLHETQVPVQAVVQQTPSVQNPLAHEAALVQAVPLAALQAPEPSQA